MKKLFVFFMLFLLNSRVNANVIGFKNGNALKSILIEGNISVHCNGDINSGPSSASYRCRMDILEPYEFDRFVGPTNTGADTVKLSNQFSNGKKITKTSEYNDQLGSSIKQINLWIRTLTQKPLLGFGENNIQYELSSKGQLIQKGSFIASVKDGGNRFCSRTGYYNSNSNSDCNFPENFCSRYFSSNNYCQ